MTEFEKKILLTEEEYYYLMEHLGHDSPLFSKPIVTQVNYYFDTDGLSMNRQNITCRVRLKDGKYKAIMKRHSGNGDQSAEMEMEMRDGIRDNAFIDMGLKLQGKLTTHRCIILKVAVRNLNKLIGDIKSETRVVVINPIRQNGLYYAVYGQDEQSGEMKYGCSSGLYFDFGDPLVTKSSNDCAEFIASYETLSRHCVLVENDNYAIGYGHTILPGEPYDADYVMEEDEALELLKSDLNIAESSISAKASNMGIRLHQHQFDALVSFAYNLGPYSQWIQVLIEEIMSGMDVHDAFAQYNKSGGVFMLGLYRRRMDETDIFVYGDYVREERPDPNA